VPRDDEREAELVETVESAEKEVEDTAQRNRTDEITNKEGDSYETNSECGLVNSPEEGDDNTGLEGSSIIVSSFGVFKQLWKNFSTNNGEKYSGALRYKFLGRLFRDPVSEFRKDYEDRKERE
jgi:hypothetical protein